MKLSSKNLARAASAGLTLSLIFVAPALLSTRAFSQVAPVVSYKLGAGDSIKIAVADHADFEQELVIPPDGTVTIPRLGTLKLAGKTRVQVQNELRVLLISRARIRQPQVAVSITQLRPKAVQRVVLSGDVPRAGSFDIAPKQRLSVLLANVGLQERLEERRATLTRGASTFALDLKAATDHPRTVADIELRGGDVISVRQITPGRVSLDGDVARPGDYELHANPRGAQELGLNPKLDDLIRKAGGLRGTQTPVPLSTNGQTLTNPTPNLGVFPNLGQPAIPTVPTAYSATLQRGGAQTTLNVEAAIGQPMSVSNITLRAGDVVRVQVVPPKPNMTVYLDGLVNQSGAQSVKEGTTVLELLASVGGPTKAPDEIVANVRRGNQLLPVDLKRLLLSSDSRANLTLQNGDILQLRDPDSVSVRVAGEVAKPGTVRLKTGSTIFEAILESGGLAIPREDARLSVLRKGANGTQRVIEANVAGIVTLQDVSTNIPLKDGDLLNVSEVQKQTVFISGEINAPGPFQLREGESLPELIIRAGGVKDDALLTQVSVERQGTVLKVDAYSAIKNGTPLDFKLQNQDRVLVPQNLNRVLVMEAVAKPGYYAIPERGQLTLLDLIAQAQPSASTKKVVLLRAGADGVVDKNIKPREIQLQDVRAGKEGQIVLQPRDIVYVISPKGPSNILRFDSACFELVAPIFLKSRSPMTNGL